MSQSIPISTPMEIQPLTLTVSYDTPSGVRRTVNALLTNDHANSVGGLHILVRTDTNAVIGKGEWLRGGYRIEESTPTARIFTECAVSTDLSGKTQF